MSTMSEAARSAAKSKAEKLVRADPNQRVDASGYMPDGALDADVKTGVRPVSRRQYASGGGVAGGAGAARADRKPRASGGPTDRGPTGLGKKISPEAIARSKEMWGHNKPLSAEEMAEFHAENERLVKRGFAPYPYPSQNLKRPSNRRYASGGRTLTADSLANTDVRDANSDRAGIKHDGGFAKGGRTAKMVGGALSPQQRMALQQRATIPSMTRPVVRAAGGKVHASGCECAKCGGGRVKRARGGAAINDGTRPVAGRLARAVGGKLGPASRQEPGSGDNNGGNYRNGLRSRNHYRDLRDSALLDARTGPEKDKNENVQYAKRMQSNVIRSLKSADGGRIARKSGGRTKKGTTVNINIVQPPQRPPMPPMGVRPPPPAGPVGMAQGMPPAGTMAPPPGAPGIPPAAPLMQRATGGRTGSYPIDAGAGGGQARLEKAARAAKQ